MLLKQNSLKLRLKRCLLSAIAVTVTAARNSFGFELCLYGHQHVVSDAGSDAEQRVLTAVLQTDGSSIARWLDR